MARSRRRKSFFSLPSFFLPLIIVAAGGYYTQEFWLPSAAPQQAEPLPDIKPVDHQLSEAGDLVEPPLQENVELEIYQWVNCTDRKQKNHDSVERESIYKWTDASGKVHFGDQPPSIKDNNSISSDRILRRMDYFHLSAQVDNGSLPPFYQDKLKPEIRKIYDILSAMLPREQWTQVDVNLQLFSTRKAYDAHREKVAPGLTANSNGFYSPHHNQASVLMERENQTFNVSRHEVTHVINHALFGWTPRWLNEGVAEYFEHLDVFAQTAEVSPSENWPRYLEHDHIMGVDFILTATDEQWNSDLRQGLYANSWALTYYLMSHREGKRAMRRLMTQLSDKRCLQVDSAEFIGQVYAGGIKRLDKNFNAWLKKGDFKKQRY